MTEIAFFSSPIGLGHATRDAAITETLDYTVEFVTGSAAAKFFAMYNYTTHDVYNPPRFDVQKGALRGSLGWLWSYYQYYKRCKKIAEQLITDTNPRLVISDEDFASLAVAQEKGIPNILITDILETRFAKGIGGMIEKKMNRSMQDIIEKCDMVIMPEYGKDEGNIRRVGPIVRQTSLSREQLREKFKLEKKTILVSIGGTDAGRFLADKISQIAAKFVPEHEIIFVSGPTLQYDFDGTINNIGFVENLHELIFASDVIVSLAGKSTIDEAVAYGTPGIFIPIKDHFEQEDNAKEYGFSHEDIYILDELIYKKLEQNRSPAMPDGVKKAAELIHNITESNA